jgi:hypothetical protein
LGHFDEPGVDLLIKVKEAIHHVDVIYLKEVMLLEMIFVIQK